MTVLTSLTRPMLAEIGVAGPLAAQVERLAALAQAAGLDGVVASPQEIALDPRACGERFAIVTPGIRGRRPTPRAISSGRDSAAGALAAGASYLVVGRPIIAAPIRAPPPSGSPPSAATRSRAA